MKVATTVTAPVHNSFRVQQVAGMFDLPPAKVLRETFEVELPGLEEAWQIGAIVGPSGSGKSTIARAAYGDDVYAGGDWAHGRALIDGFGDAPIRQVTRTLTAVGLGSPPSWLKPFYALSTGEKFRADLAKALLGCRLSAIGCRQEEEGGRLSAIGCRPEEEGCQRSAIGCQPEKSTTSLADSREPTADSLFLADSREPIAESPPRLVVFDEFTSVVDRTVAKVASAAVAKAIRGGQIAARLVVVSCHSDILPWLAPDWHLDMATGRLARDCLRRPPIELRVVEARHAAWKLFARHHYLSGGLSRAASVYVALWGETPVALCATVALYGHAGRRRIHRLVTLPDFQGVGIGARLLDFVAQKKQREGQRVNITTSHPAVIAHCRRSSRWRAVGVQRSGGARQKKEGVRIRGSSGRATVSFEYEVQTPLAPLRGEGSRSHQAIMMSHERDAGTFDVPTSGRRDAK
jgi:GNAT superfamily N-acetyltransferase